MEFCNKGMVRADPPPPVMVKDHKMTIFLGPFPKCFKWINVIFLGTTTNWV